MTKITLLLKLFVYLLVFKFVFTLNTIYYYYHYTLFIVCAHFRLMFGFCCVAVSLLFRVAPSSVRLFLPVHPYMCCADFSCTSTHPPAERSPSFTFFSHFFLFSLFRWRDGAGYWSPWGRVLWFDIELRLELSTTGPSQRWILGGGVSAVQAAQFPEDLRGLPMLFNLHEPSPEN